MTEQKRADCLELWASLTVMSVALIFSVTANITFCIIKLRKGKEVKFINECAVREEQYIENNPIYGNLNQPILGHVDESCYELMSNPYQRNREEVKHLEPQETMCYADLDLGPKKPKKTRKKKATSLNANNSAEDVSPLYKSNVLSSSSIYLNSEQLAVECRRQQGLAHDDTIRMFKKMQKTKNNMFAEDQSQIDCAKFGTC